ncbi:hypothetical protein ABI59_17900 [Acidobacteria bacterium Mor1]|nr:hypothetical protein ABI59_17900 [Acidobacteria bacterium Mor1]
MAGGASREFDVVVWGASGFTGRLVAEHLSKRYPPESDLRWAMAGRNREKLEQVRRDLGEGGAEIPLLIADSHDAGSLTAMVRRARVVCSTVGPFARYGDALVAACAEHGTHYADITGEIQWVRRMIDRHEETARQSGARLVHCCGFDSIPADLGCRLASQAMQDRHGRACDEIKYLVRRIKGTFSGGTVASLLHVFDEVKQDRSIRRILANPYSIAPDTDRRPRQVTQRGPSWDEDLGSWTAPYVMAAVDEKIVHRSNALNGDAYGRGLRYREAICTGRGPAGYFRALSATAGLTGFMAGVAFPPTRALLNRFVLPQPGEGPDREQREKGLFKIVVVGTAGEQQVRVRIDGERDPGYGATSRMLGESAACLAIDGDTLPVGGGSWTPASCMADALRPRLARHAGVTFAVEEPARRS